MNDESLFSANKISAKIFLRDRNFHSKLCQQHFRRSRPNVWGCHSEHEHNRLRKLNNFVCCNYGKKI
jgi:hypothetical protein